MNTIHTANANMTTIHTTNTYRNTMHTQRNTIYTTDTQRNTIHTANTHRNTIHTLTEPSWINLDPALTSSIGATGVSVIKIPVFGAGTARTSWFRVHRIPVEPKPRLTWILMFLAVLRLHCRRELRRRDLCSWWKVCLIVMLISRGNLYERCSHIVMFCKFHYESQNSKTW